MLVDDTKVIRYMRPIDDHAALRKPDLVAFQKDLDLLYEWLGQWQLKFNVLKYKHLRFRPAHNFEPYYMNGVEIDSVESQKDLGFLFDHQLKFHSHTINIATEATRLLGLIKRFFDHLDSDILIKLFVTLVHPTIEYCNPPVREPSFILRRTEKIQHRATRLLPPIREKPYGERLSILNSPSLAHRLHRGDMMLLYKILNGYFNSALYTYSNTTITRGHHFKLFKY